ncbi:MAG TPA: tRNA pseudouridine(38-40) synthase TruA [Acidobacteriota bacterium]|nr:tRNA pseudouridine(38-40) synthase TruA [Acidobacteriota bacterium]
MPKWKLVIEYQGTRYRGWQEQANARTVQGELRKAAETLLGERPEIVGAGRTDAGVHALKQVAYLRAHDSLPAAKLRRELNDVLPADINILDVAEAPPRFHARHDAVERFYLYQVSTQRRAFAKPFVWWVKDSLAVETMKAAASLLPGRHDFSAFCDKGGTDVSTLVEVSHSELARHGDLILFRIGASHFLWKMVRRIVGVLVEIGRGNLSLNDLGEFMADSTAQVAEWTAPPSGLFLEAVLYEGDKAPGELLPAFFFRH